jgi:4-amino-4-deoxy-L-arabinose transferase-like glycosyltransferase
MTVLYHGVLLCYILAFFVFFTFSEMTFGRKAKFVAILIMLLTISTYQRQLDTHIELLE